MKERTKTIGVSKSMDQRHKVKIKRQNCKCLLSIFNNLNFRFLVLQKK